MVQLILNAPEGDGDSVRIWRIYDSDGTLNIQGGGHSGKKLTETRLVGTASVLFDLDTEDTMVGMSVYAPLSGLDTEVWRGVIPVGLMTPISIITPRNYEDLFNVVVKFDEHTAPNLLKSNSFWSNSGVVQCVLAFIILYIAYYAYRRVTRS